MSRTFHDLKPGERLFIGQSRVTVEQKSGQRVRLRVEADADVPVSRKAPPAESQTAARRPAPSPVPALFTLPAFAKRPPLRPVPSAG